MTRIFLLGYTEDMKSTWIALAEPNRLHIVELLRDGPLTVGEIAERLRLHQPQVSKHLRILGDAGFVEVHPLANRRIYQLQAKPFEELDTWLETFKHVWETRLDALDEYLHQLQEEQHREREKTMTDTTNNVKKRDLIVTRIFNAPLEFVWKAWTEPEHVMRWWGPNYFTSPTCEIDFREGGTSLVCMRSPEGQDFYSTWTYRKIVPLQQIEFIQNLAGKDGRRVDPVKMGLRPDFPQDMRTVVTFKAVGDQTELTITEYDLPDTQMFEYAELGLNQSLDKMAASFARA